MGKVNIEGKNLQKRFDFSGTSLPTGWSIISQGSGMTVGVANSILTISTGTTAGAETIVRYTTPVQLKFIARFIASLSQRIANQSFYLEVVNAGGTTYGQWLFDGTTATSAKYDCANNGVASGASTVTIPTTASYATFEIYGEIEQTLFAAVAANSNSAKSGNGMRDRLTFETDENYYIQIRATNGATPPATSTDFNIDCVIVEDLTMIGVEILRADGSTHPAAGMPTRVLAGTVDTVTTLTTGYTAPKTTRYSDTSATLGANASFTGTGRDTGATSNYDRFKTFVVASHTGTLYVEQSSDNTNWYVTDTYNVAANTPVTNVAQVVMRYVRLRYTNGATPQSSFKLDSLLAG